ncbi:MAG: deoxyribodipyrimidine photo-lyase, partial [Chitinophagaceae bacterium]|nr:deoxyribodipyrimidine photo-lyase [Chitinophagaceae bacterium]
MIKPAVSIFWFRRDLRLHDNAGLYHALKQGKPVVPIFIFDKNILEELENRTDRRVEFIYHSLQEMQQQLVKIGSSLDARYGSPAEIFKQLLRDYTIENVFINHDYEPYARKRDKEIEELLKSKGISFQTYKDQVIFEKAEVVKDDGKAYTIFTPYSRRWKTVVNDFYLRSYPVKTHFSNFYKQATREIPSLRSMNFKTTDEPFPPKKWNEEIISRYPERRDLPAMEGTSGLSVHLRFGTVSIRELAREAGKLSETFLNELIWRDFYHMILWHFPHVEGRSFKPGYDKIIWRNNEKEFNAWCEGATGYPIVD